jgi:REP element-mobilizing transposase RayT
MDNHFHLVVETPRANLSAFMRHLNVSYSGYFNRRYKRVGHLYQGRFIDRCAICLSFRCALLGLA